jgi:hypothetical protein
VKDKDKEILQNKPHQQKDKAVMIQRERPTVEKKSHRGFKIKGLKRNNRKDNLEDKIEKEMKILKTLENLKGNKDNLADKLKKKTITMKLESLKDNIARTEEEKKGLVRAEGLIEKQGKTQKEDQSKAKHTEN